jgi:hypothetical protein
MPDGSYTSDGLRTGSGVADETASIADKVRTRLNGRAVTGTWFGTVAGADQLATGLGTSRDDWARTGGTVAQAHQNLSARSTASAGHADELTAESEQTASSVQPGAITDGMG